MRSRCLPGRRLTVRHVAQAPKNSVVRTSAADSLLEEMLVLICFEDGQGECLARFFRLRLVGKLETMRLLAKHPHFTDNPVVSVIALVTSTILWQPRAAQMTVERTPLMVALSIL